MTQVYPLSQSRITDFLESEDLKYLVDDDGEIGISFSSAMTWISFGESAITSIRANWRGRASDENDVSALVNEIRLCNQNRTAPKAILVDTQEGHTILCSVSIQLENGFSDQQWSEFFNSSLTACLAFLSDVEEKLPHLVTWTEET